MAGSPAIQMGTARTAPFAASTRRREPTPPWPGLHCIGLNDRRAMKDDAKIREIRQGDPNGKRAISL